MSQIYVENAVKRSSSRRNVKFLLVVSLLASVGLAAEAPFAMSALVAPKGGEQRNPVTEISVGFGDVAHLSPWRIKRRFPRSSGTRGGQPVTLRDAFLAVNEFVAQDEEMPERTFVFAADGSLVSVCDVPVDKTAVRIDGEEKVLSMAMLDEPARDFRTVAFRKVGGVQKNGSAQHAAADGRQTGETKTIVLPGGAKMEMIWCAPGSFLMGSPQDEEGRFSDELLHPVKLTRGFWLGKYEVTQEQWKSVMGENRSRFQGPNRPIDNISWEDCRRFIDKVNVLLGGVARFPTEAEWEYACRAGSSAAVAGNGQLADMAWYDDNSGSRTHAVGKNQPNDWGFYDMHGNVLEWCADWFSSDISQSVDPTGPASGSFRVLRGGCWFFYARDCRSAYRLKRDPGIRNCIYGFRLACSEK